PLASELPAGRSPARRPGSPVDSTGTVREGRGGAGRGDANGAGPGQRLSQPRGGAHGAKPVRPRRRDPPAGRRPENRRGASVRGAISVGVSPGQYVANGGDPRRRQGKARNGGRAPGHGSRYSSLARPIERRARADAAGDRGSTAKRRGRDGRGLSGRRGL